MIPKRTYRFSANVMLERKSEKATRVAQSAFGRMKTR
jgi:hypothetical protein